jgi:hypothetical protein
MIISALIPKPMLHIHYQYHSPLQFYYGIAAFGIMALKGFTMILHPLFSPSSATHCHRIVLGLIDLILLRHLNISISHHPWNDPVMHPYCFLSTILYSCYEIADLLSEFRNSFCSSSLQAI